MADMKMTYKLETRVYIKPGEGQTVYELSKEIEQFVNEPEHDGFKVFVIKPDGEMFEIIGKDFLHVHGSIFTNCVESVFTYQDTT